MGNTDKVDVSGMFGGEIDVVETPPVEAEIEAEIPAETDQGQAEPTNNEEANDAKTTETKHSFVEKVKKSLVPERVVAEQRDKKRKAQELAEKYERENAELRAQIEKLKAQEDITPEMADDSLSMLDKMDDDDVLDVATAKRELQKIAKAIGKTASKQAMKAASEYVQQQEALKQEALTKQKQQVMLEKAAKDEAAFAKKHPDIDFNMVYEVAERQGLITRDEFAEIAILPGNIVENTYNRIKQNKAKVDKFSALLNGTNNAEQLGGNTKSNDFEPDPLFARSS